MSRSTKEISLANLSEFISRQEAHLQRTRADIEKLDALRQRVRADPEGFVKNLTEELSDPAFRRPPVEYLRMPAVDWSLLPNLDPRVFDSLTPLPSRKTLRESHPLREKLDEFVQESGLPPIERPSYRPRELSADGEEGRNERVSPAQDDSGAQTGDFADDMLTDDEIPSPPTPGRPLVPSLPTSSLLPTNTHNQHWTTAEQRLLEKYLALIPPTEPHRWAKISRAMKEEGADRAPRQVGSRVQKMFQKMEKMGVVTDGAFVGGGRVGDGGRKKRRREEEEEEGKGRADGGAMAKAKLQRR